MSSSASLFQSVTVLMPAYLMVFLCAFFISCADDEAPSPQEQVVGVWTLSEVNLVSAQDINNDGTASNNLMLEISCLETTITIVDDNSWTVSSKEFVVADNQIVNDCTNILTSNGSWSISEQGQFMLGDTSFEIGHNQLIKEHPIPILGIDRVIYRKQ
ncbi:MAG: DUF5004 domain-containing protein [Bacteroidota bacterium]